MRLTLRTLLAYLDGILEPNDAEDIAKKVEESEYASGLVHRIRDVMRRLRLGAPTLTGKGPDLDPNTVAEYLDNTLSSSDVTDFEKVCLDSDVHLAEVASSHQILTLVLGEPAEIDPQSRERMYQLKDAQASATPPPITARPAGAAPTLDLGDADRDWSGRKPRLKPTVPEYLRDPHKKRRRWPVAAAVALVVCLAVVVLMVLGQFERDTLLGDALARLFTASEDVATRPEDAEPGSLTKGQETQQVSQADKSTGEPTETSAEDAATESGTAPSTAPVEEPGETATGDVVAEPGVETVVDVAGEGPPEKAVTEPSVEPEAVSENEPVVPMPPLPPEPLGRLVSSNQVLLKDDPASGWVRVAANQMLMPQRLLVLPTYRAKLTLTVGITLEILGDTQIELLASSPGELPGIRALYGRVVLAPLAEANAGLRVVFGDRSGVVTFSDAESVAALEVWRVHLLGTDPEAGPPHIVANLYSVAGGVAWDEASTGEAQEVLRLAPSQWVRFNAGWTSAPMAAEKLPAWIVAEPLGPLDQRASAALAEGLRTDRLARLGLLELRLSRPQKEVKWLALRCLANIGQFRDMIAMLNDVDHKLNWPDYIAELRAAVARDPESAEAVHADLEKQYPRQADELYRMLWGYSDEDLQAGEDEELVRALDDDLLAVRVLSYWNLKDLTGLGLFYKPEQTPAKRQQPMLRWRQRLEAKEIRVKAPAETSGGEPVEDAVPPVEDPKSSVVP